MTAGTTKEKATARAEATATAKEKAEEKAESKEKAEEKADPSPPFANGATGFGMTAPLPRKPRLGSG
jgi:hypothetical protein